MLHQLEPIQLKDHPDAVWSIQQQLLRDDAFIIAAYNEDPRDYARLATATATSEAGNGTSSFGAAANVLSGQSRAVVTGQSNHQLYRKTSKNLNVLILISDGYDTISLERGAGRNWCTPISVLLLKERQLMNNPSFFFPALASAQCVLIDDGCNELQRPTL